MKIEKYKTKLKILILLVCITAAVTFLVFVLKQQTKTVVDSKKSELKSVPRAMKKLIIEKNRFYSEDSASLVVPILMYHYVENVTDKRDTIRQSLNVPPSIFEEQIKTLKDAGYTFLTAKEFGEILDDEKKLIDKSVLITFDDGHNDLVSDVLPILRKYDIKATVYVISGFIDRLDFLTTQELFALIQSSHFEIGAHTVHHASLSGTFNQIAKYEIEESKKELEEKFKIKVVSFAYPNGSFDNQATELVKNAGYTTAVSTIHGVRQNRQNRFFLNRIRPGSATGDYLLRMIED